MAPRKTKALVAKQEELARIHAPLLARIDEIESRRTGEPGDLTRMIAEMIQVAADLFAVAETAEQLDTTARLALANQLATIAGDINIALALQGGEAAPNMPGYMTSDEGGVTVRTNRLRLTACSAAMATARRAAELRGRPWY